ARMTELIMEMEAHKDGPLSGNVRIRLREILEQLREVVSLLQQETDIILEEEIREYLDRLVSTGRFDLDAVISGVNAQPEQRFHLHRIFLELMTNVVRHSGARKIKIRLRRNRYGIQLSVADNGAGIPEDYTPGNGLRNIQRRARRLNARLRMHSRERHGTVASVLVRERSPSVFT
ncbi:MAG: hypothetical protein KDK34_02625, partial [Leptospiraceae bacterium]|nr:hypothetical protein [Leptospiraceae bacterium]